MFNLATVPIVGIGVRFCALACASVVCIPLVCAAPQALQDSPRDLYHALNALRVDARQVYYVREIHLRRDVVRLTLVEGKLGFLSAHDGRITGAVFTGRGHVLALPRDPIEKQSLARFVGAPLLDQGFSRAYLRFTDDAGQDLLRQLRQAGIQPADLPAFAEEWNSTIANLNPLHSLRILMDWLAEAPQPYFYAGLAGDLSGTFDVLVDNRRAEQILLGQSRWAEGQSFYDVWASFSRGDAPKPPVAPFEPATYKIETSILPDRILEGTTTLRLRAARAGERVIALELSRFLSVQSAEDSQGHPLVYFQNEALARQELAHRGNDSLLVVLPAAARASEQIELRIRYCGSVISDAGNGVYYVGARGSWYPHVGGEAYFAPFELTFRWSRRLQLVATGKKLDEREEGEWRTSRWRSETPMPVAGFNLGEYAAESVEAGGLRVELYANRQLEAAILERLRQPVIVPQVFVPSVRRGRPVVAPTIIPPEPAPSPAAVLKELGREIAEAAHFLERYNGAFPYSRLGVSQIPGTFGQGWPSLIYLSTLAFLPSEAQRRVGLNPPTRAHLSEIVPFHEVAHQWWGNQVGWSHYRDQWIHEGLSNYLALLYADFKKPSERPLFNWLARYRKTLTEKQPGQEESPEDAGPLTFGQRLRSSKLPSAIERVLYGKGTWVFHMLREMLREPSAKDPDARFSQLLQALLEKHRHRALTTEDLQRAVENVMTSEMGLEGGRSMEWFFDQWVHSTAIPRYAVKFATQPTANGFLIRGVLKQKGVPEHFVAAVPLYAVRTAGKPVLLGTVIASGSETRFEFLTRVRPRQLQIDPQLTLLCRTD